MHRRVLVIVVMFLATCSARGQSSPTTDQTEQVKALLERVEQLEKRLAEVEAKQAASPVTSAAISNVSTPQKSESQEATVSPGPAHDHMTQEQNVAQQAEVH